MKLLGADVILLVVGLLLIAGAGWPLVAGGYLAQNAAGGTTGPGSSLFDVAFPTADLPAKQQGINNLGVGNSVFAVAESNVTKVHVEITCSDTAPGAAASPFTFTITVTGPNGLTGTVAGKTCGAAATIDVPVAPVPTPKKISASDAKAAEAASGGGNQTKAKGDWTVKTTGQRGVGGTLPVQPVPPPAGIVKFASTTWTAKATPAPATK